MSTLRDARPSDRDAIEAVTLAAYEQYATVLSPPLWTLYRQSIQATLRDVRPAAQIVAEDDGVLVGTVLLYPSGAVIARPAGTPVALASPEVRLLAVAPAARGKGVGRRLMEECLRRARAAGASALTLHTADIMSVAVRLYEGMGFVRAVELDFSPAPGITVKGYRIPLTLPSPLLGEGRQENEPSPPKGERGR